MNGCGIARDAAGRGWRTVLLEMGDLGGATSSASSKLIHGGLRYLEHYEFRLVQEALREREVLWGIAPHIVWPLRFVLPHHAGLRPAWLLRLGLFIYDHLGGRRWLPGARGVDLRRDPAGAALKAEFTRGFEYSDCWVEDSRLVVLNARDAAERGASIRPRTRCMSARVEGGQWALALSDGSRVRARALVNAAGPWVGDVLREVVGENAPATVRLVKGSHIVVPRLYEHGRCYTFQNADGRVFFAIPYETDFTLIGTTDQDYAGDPGAAQASGEEVQYLCGAASAYFRTAVTPGMVVWSYAGVRPLFDDGTGSAQEATRDYVLSVEGAPPLLSVFGGKITTYRKLAEDALHRLGPFLPPAAGMKRGMKRGMKAGWTGSHALPGGHFARDGFETLVAALAGDYPFVPAALLRRLARAFGTDARGVLGGARSMRELGPDLGAGLTGAELAWLVQHEFAQTAEDVVWRRSKLGLRMTPEEVARVGERMERPLPIAALPAAMGSG